MLKISPRWKKIVIYTFSAIFLLMITLWALVFWYVNTHKAEIISKIETTLSEKVAGKVEIKDIQPDFLKSFPRMNFRLDGMSLQDSMYATHKIKLLELEHAYARLDFLPLLKGKITFSKLTLENGEFYLFVDSLGYSNGYLLKPKPGEEKKDKGSPQKLEISVIEISNFRVKIVNSFLDKHFEFKFNSLIGRLNVKEDVTNITFSTNAELVGLGFNLDNGYFLKNAVLKTSFAIDYTDSNKTFNVKKTNLNINGEKLKFWASIKMDKSEDIPFTLNFVGDELNYNEAVKWMSANILEKLNILKFGKPLDVRCTVKGGFTRRGETPQIILNFETKDNKAKLLTYAFEKVRFKGSYNNQVLSYLPAKDPNSTISLDTLYADFDGLPLNGRNILVNNLKKPYIKANLMGTFPAKAINNLLANQFNFTEGTASYNIVYDGNLFANTLIADKLYGEVLLNDGTFVYQERNLKFDHSNANLKFAGTDLQINRFQIHSGTSDMNITGLSKDFLTAFMELPGKAMMNLNLKSQHIDLGEFQTYFVQKRSSKAKVSTGTAVKNASDKLDAFLNSANIYLGMQIGKAEYKKFAITNLQSAMRFQESGIVIDKLQLGHSGGIVLVTGGINQQAVNNPFKANVDISKVRVDRFFTAMNNFGFKGLTSKNLDGNVSIKANLIGKISDKGVLNENSLNGHINYSLEDAALKNYSIFDNLSSFFPKRDLDNIQIPQFSGEMDIADGTIYLPKTNLKTSALQLSFEGKYGFAANRPTAINFRVPLRNPKIDEKRLAKGMKKRKGEGIVLNFKATSGADGKVKIGVGTTSEAKRGEE